MIKVEEDEMQLLPLIFGKFYLQINYFLLIIFNKILQK